MQQDWDSTVTTLKRKFLEYCKNLEEGRTAVPAGFNFNGTWIQMPEYVFATWCREAACFKETRKQTAWGEYSTFKKLPAPKIS